MYGEMLRSVVTAVEKTIGREPSPNEQWDAFYNQMFNPEGYKAYLEEQKKRETRRNVIILTATGLAVLAEATHYASKSDAVKNLLKGK